MDVARKLQFDDVSCAASESNNMSRSTRSKGLAQGNGNSTNKTLASAFNTSNNCERIMTRSKSLARRNGNSIKRKSTTRQRRLTTPSLKEIRRYQQSVENLIKKTPHDRLCREIAQGIRCDWRFPSSTLTNFHNLTESFLPNVLNDSQECAIHAKRVTPQPKDVKLAWRLRGDKKKYGDLK